MKKSAIYSICGVVCLAGAIFGGVKVFQSTYAPGNVRVTLDFNIRTGLMCTDFLKPDVPTIPVNEDPIILEVKWDEYLPEIIRAAVQTNVKDCAYSKYAECRMFD